MTMLSLIEPLVGGEMALPIGGLPTLGGFLLEVVFFFFVLTFLVIFSTPFFSLSGVSFLLPPIIDGI